MSKIIRWLIAAVAAGFVIWLAERYLLKAPDGSSGYVPVGPGFGVDDVTLGIAGLAGAAAGAMLASKVG